MADHAPFTDWIERYERAWRTAGTEPLRGLFTDDATYSPAPFDEPLRGLEAIAAFWDGERDGPDEVFALTARLLAVEPPTGVARIDVTYGEPRPTRYADLWVITLEPDGRASAFEEWPFFPGQGRVAPSS